ncbi:MAG: response regulator [Zetaproteobacteria bacterium]|nr:response regulator [Zetaproteobacteria bacterium]
MMQATLGEIIAVEHDTILVVDDDPLLRDVTTAMLASVGWDVVTASSGQEALEALALYDDVGLIVMDVLMPGMSGFEAAGKIKKHEVWRKIPILFLSATEVDQQWFDVGAVMFMSKPIHKQTLLNNVEIFQRYYQQEMDLIALHNDVLHKKQEIDHLQRLESIGTLASGIAHDFNNYLAGIIGNADLLKLNHPEIEQEPLNHILDISTQARRLCQSLMGYAKNQGPVIKKFSLSHVVSSMTVLLHSAIHAKVNIVYDMDDRGSDYVIEGDQSQFEQLVMNLIINASEAIMIAHDEGGSVQVSTRKVYMEAAMFKQGFLYDVRKPLNDHDYIYLKVRDNGCGIPKEALTKIFDPFYTTKATGNGLGLSAIMGIVQSHGGAMKVDSEEGLGTVFHLYFPVQKTALAGQQVDMAELIDRQAERAVVALQDFSGRTALIIDDNASIRQITRGFLKKVGANCLEAENGQVGVEMFMAHKDSIDFVILDMTMPVMNGYECSQALYKIQADVRIIVSTGYASTTFSEEEVSRLAGFLPKPYTSNEFYQAIQGAVLLDQGQENGIADTLFDDNDDDVFFADEDDDDDDFLNDLIPEFLSLCDVQMKKIADAMAVSDFEVIKVEAHDLKGSCGTFGFSELSVIAASLEQCAKNQSPETSMYVASLIEKFSEISANRLPI